MPRLDLLEPLLTDGIRHAHWFNGRVLTAEALQDEQAALHRHVDLLGRALGDGVAFGLDVTAGPILSGVPTVEVTPGLALNRKGQPLAIPDALGTVTVALDREPPTRALPEGTGRFEACRPGGDPGDGLFQPTLDPGAYVLAIGPVATAQGRVPGVAAGGDGVARFCGSRYEVEGVVLRLVPLALDADVAALVQARVRSGAVEDRTMAQNVLAHLCLGTPDLGAIRSAPRTGGERYGLVDALRQAGDLDACEVPLALLYWDTSALRFVDAWAVRRRLAPAAAAPDWRLHAAARRRAESEAAFLQFQGQVQAVRSAGGFRLRAVDAFRYLPAGGYVPAASEERFFSGIPVRRRLRADEAFLRALLDASFDADPIDLTADPVPEVDVYALPSSDLVLFLRAAAVAEAERPAEPTVGTGRLVVTVDLDPDGERDLTIGEREERARQPLAGRESDERTASGERDERFMVTLGAAPVRGDAALDDLVAQVDRRLRVEATGRTTRTTHRGTLNTKRLREVLADPFGQNPRAVEELVFTFPPLPPDSYLVRLSGEGIQTQSTQRAVAAETTVRVTLDLLAGKDPGRPSGPPPTRAPAGEIANGWYDEVRLTEAFVDRYARWPWPPEDPSRYERLAELPDEIVTFLDTWGAELAERHPNAPLTADVAVYVDAGYTPDGTPPDAPYAYAVYGEAGTYIPLVLTATNRSFGHPVGVGKSGLFGADAGIERRLDAVGAAEADVLANAWGGLVADATGVGAEAARDIVAGAREAVDALQGSLAQFTGVTPALADALTQAGFATPADLANASAQGLLDALGDDAGGLSRAWVELLVGEARASVPRGTWALDDLDRDLRDALDRAGARSLGDFERLAQDDARAADLARDAGLADEAVRDRAEAAARDRTRHAARLDADRAAAAPVSGVEGIGASEAVALAKAGLGSTGALSRANPDVVARTLGIDAAAARTAVMNARARIGGR